MPSSLNKQITHCLWPQIILYFVSTARLLLGQEYNWLGWVGVVDPEAASSTGACVFDVDDYEKLLAKLLTVVILLLMLFPVLLVYELVKNVNSSSGFKQCTEKAKGCFNRCTNGYFSSGNQGIDASGADTTTLSGRQVAVVVVVLKAQPGAAGTRHPVTPRKSPTRRPASLSEIRLCGLRWL